MQLGIALQTFGPIIAHGFLPFEFSRGLSGDLGNERRRHLKVVCVVRKDSIQIVAIPGSNPLGRKVIRKSPVQHNFAALLYELLPSHTLLRALKQYNHCWASAGRRKMTSVARL